MKCEAGCSRCDDTGACLEQCDSSVCLDCVGQNDKCISCPSGLIFWPEGFTCIENCSAISGLYFDEAQNACLNCSENCEQCSSANQCTQCKAGYFKRYITQSDGSIIVKCVQECAEGEWPDSNTQTCIECGLGCEQCSAPQGECNQCSRFTIQNGTQCYCPYELF